MGTKKTTFNLVQHGYPHGTIVEHQSRIPSSIKDATVHHLPPSDFKQLVLKMEWSENVEQEYTSETTYFEYAEFIRKIQMVEELKDNLGLLTPSEMKAGRKATSPFDRLPTKMKGYYMHNRATWKYIEINALYNNLFCKQEAKWFADLCCAPGAFTLFMKQTNRNYPTLASLITLGNSIPLHSDFKRHSKFFEYDCVFGDVTEAIVQDHFINRSGGYHMQDIVLADGGFDFTGIERQQEYRCRTLYLAQFYLALTTLKAGGSFMCKLFNVYSKFSISLLYLVSCSFEKSSITKPLTSRAANSEKYVIFENYTPHTEIIMHLEYVIRCKEANLNRLTELAVVPKAFKDTMVAALVSVTDTQIEALNKFLNAKVETKTDDEEVDPIDAILNANDDHFLNQHVDTHAKRWLSVVGKN